MYILWISLYTLYIIVYTLILALNNYHSEPETKHFSDVQKELEHALLKNVGTIT